MNRRQSWVPRGSQRITALGADDGQRKLFAVRLRVEQIISPPGFSRAQQAAR